MASVFISYAREDAPKAKAIARGLEEASVDVWFDDRIRSGAEYSHEIETALKGALAVMVLWSRNSVQSAWVRDEAAEGRDTGRLISVRIDDCRPPIGFRQYQTTNLSRWSGRGKPKQLDDITAAIAAITGTRASPSPAATATWWKRRPAWAAGALVVLAAAAIFVFMGRTGSFPPRPRASR